MSYFHLGRESETDACPSLTIRAIDAGVAGGTCYALCDRDGYPLPMQSDCQIDNPTIMGGLGSVTATFHIDGKSVKIAA